MDAPVQETPEEQVTRLLQMLAAPGLKQIARDIALSNLARAFMEERIANANLEKERDAFKFAADEALKTVFELRAWKEEALRFENSLKSIMLEREAPGSQTSETPRRSPPRLSVVRPDANAEARHAFIDGIARGEGPTP